MNLKYIFALCIDVIILYRQDCTATIKLISELQVLLKRAVFESAAIVTESRDSFPGKFPFIGLGRPAMEVCLHELLSANSTFKNMQWNKLYCIATAKVTVYTSLPFTHSAENKKEFSPAAFWASCSVIGKYPCLELNTFLSKSQF